MSEQNEEIKDKVNKDEENFVSVWSKLCVETRG